MNPAHPKESLECDETMTTRTMLVQLCAASRVSLLWPAATQPGIEPGSVVTPQALRCIALDCCATQEALFTVYCNGLNYSDII